MVLPWGDACEPGGELRCEDNADGKADCDDKDFVNAAPCQPSQAECDKRGSSTSPQPLTYLT